MATLLEAVYDILLTDAQSAVAGSLGVLLGYNAVSKPRCVFFQNPPDEPDPPYLTYGTISEAGFFPREILIQVTCWGDEHTAVLHRVWELLQKKIQVTATDFSIKAVLFDFAGPQLWDEDLKCYMQQHRYRFIVVQI